MAARLEVALRRTRLRKKSYRKKRTGADQGEVAQMKVSGIVRIMLAVVCAMAGPLLFPAAGTSASQQTSWTLENVLKQMDTQAADFHSLTADLERTKVTVVVNDKSTESGQILVRRDDKMRIELTQPDARTILRDGDNFYIYNPKIHRVEEYNLGKKKSVVDQFLLLGFGTSGKSLKESYSITLQGEETLDNHKVLLLELVPKTDEVQTAAFENPVVAGRIHLASRAAAVFRDRIGRLFHHPLQEYGAEREDSGYRIQTPLAARHDENPAAIEFSFSKQIVPRISVSDSHRASESWRHHCLLS